MDAEDRGALNPAQPENDNTEELRLRSVTVHFRWEATEARQRPIRDRALLCYVLSEQPCWSVPCYGAEGYEGRLEVCMIDRKRNEAISRGRTKD